MAHTYPLRMVDTGTFRNTEWQIAFDPNRDVPNRQKYKVYVRLQGALWNTTESAAFKTEALARAYLLGYQQGVEEC